MLQQRDARKELPVDSVQSGDRLEVRGGDDMRSHARDLNSNGQQSVRVPPEVVVDIRDSDAPRVPH